MKIQKHMIVGFVTDIHEDLESLDKAFRQMKKIGCDQIICLGDISGYNLHLYNYFQKRDASACLSMIQENCNVIVRGNHDLFSTRTIPEFTAGFNYPEDWYHLDFHQKKDLSKDRLWLYEPDELDALYTSEEKEYIQGLPEYAIVEFENFNVLVSHYIYPNINGTLRGFYLDRENFEEHFRFMKKRNCLYSFSGHEHAQGFIKVTSQILNQYGFEKNMLRNEPTTILTPAIVRGRKPNGFLIFNTQTMEIRSIKL